MFKKLIILLFLVIGIERVITLCLSEDKKPILELEDKKFNDIKIRFGNIPNSLNFRNFVVNRKHNAVLLMFIMSGSMREIGVNNFVHKHERDVGCILMGELLKNKEFRAAFPSLRYNIKREMEEKQSGSEWCIDRALLDALLAHHIWQDNETYIKLKSMYGSEISDMAYKNLFCNTVDEVIMPATFPDETYRNAVCVSIEYLRRVAECESENDAEEIVKRAYSYALGSSFLLWGYGKTSPFHEIINERMLDYAKELDDDQLAEALFFASDGQEIIFPNDKKGIISQDPEEIVNFWRQRIENSLTIHDFLYTTETQKKEPSKNGSNLIGEQ